MNPEIKKKILEVVLSEPFLTLKEVADKVGLSKSTVSRAVASTKVSGDRQLVAKAAGNFLQDFANIIEFWKLQITELEHLKEGVKDPKILMKIMREQSDRYVKILALARQGELVQAIRKINQSNKPEFQRT